MDFIEWCDLVLAELVSTIRASPRDRTFGIHHRDLAHSICQTLGSTTTYEDEVYDALVERQGLGLIDEGAGARYWKPTSDGRSMASGAAPLWPAICAIELDDEHREMLTIVNHLSHYQADDHAGVNWLKDVRRIPEFTGIDPDLVYPLASELKEHGFVGLRAFSGGHTDLHTTYRGLVWETRRSITVESAFIDDLVAEWETTSVEIKRELSIDTADQKAEFVKDVIGLANTKASGRRWLIVGFDDKTRTYHGPPDSRLDQNPIEQILRRYTEPMIQVRYEAVPYRDGWVEKLEVRRDASQLPYRVAESVGDKKRINYGDIFVRHGSQTEAPTSAELQALIDEATRANQAD